MSIPFSLYIPLCLYFNQTESLQFLHNFFFTFHYVSILISALQNLSTGSSLLYIPLCLYFNDESQHSPGGTEAFTFHYVSILIINAHCRRQNTKCLYIPLCLYFNIHADIFMHWPVFPLHSIMSLF